MYRFNTNFSERHNNAKHAAFPRIGTSRISPLTSVTEWTTKISTTDGGDWVRRVRTVCHIEHTRHIGRGANLRPPCAQRLVEFSRIRKHLVKFCRLLNIPDRQVLVKRKGTFKLYRTMIRAIESCAKHSKERSASQNPRTIRCMSVALCTFQPDMLLLKERAILNCR